MAYMPLVLEGRGTISSRCRRRVGVTDRYLPVRVAFILSPQPEDEEDFQHSTSGDCDRLLSSLILFPRWMILMADGTSLLPSAHNTHQPFGE